MLKDDKITNTEKLTREVLQTPLHFSLPDNFADKVAFKAARRFKWEQYFREFLFYLAVLAGILALTGVMAFIWLKTSWEAWLNLFVSNIWLVICVSFTLLFILFVDKVLLRYFFYRFSNNRMAKI